MKCIGAKKFVVQKDVNKTLLRRHFVAYLAAAVYSRFWLFNYTLFQQIFKVIVAADF